MVVVSILPYVEFWRNYHLEVAPHFIFAIFDHVPSILVSLYAFIHDLYVSQSEKNEFREYKSDESSVLINKQKKLLYFLGHKNITFDTLNLFSIKK